MRTAFGGLLLFALAAGGCWNLPVRVDDKPTLEMGVPAPGRSRPPVTAEQVTEGNARELADALWEELDRDQSRPQVDSPVRRR